MTIPLSKLSVLLLLSVCLPLSYGCRWTRIRSSTSEIWYGLLAVDLRYINKLSLVYQRFINRLFLHLFAHVLCHYVEKIQV